MKKTRLLLTSLAMLSMAIGLASCGKETNIPTVPDATPTSIAEVATNTPTPNEPTIAPTAAPEMTVTPDVEIVTPTQAPTAEATDAPTETDVTKTPESTETPAPTEEVAPTATVAPTENVKPTEAPTVTPEPTATVAPTATPEPTATPKPTTTPKPTNTPKPSATSKPTITPAPTPTPAPTATPKPVVTVSQTEVFAEKVANAMGIEALGDQTYTDVLVANGILSREVAEKSALSRKDSFVVLHKVAEKYNALDADMMQIALDRNRISDMKSCTEEEIQSAYALYSAGIVEGEMDGLYSHTRSMNPKQLLTNEDLDLYLNRITGVAEKRVLSFDGQITRTTNLPDARYAKWYAYFLESFPNEYYENEFPIMKVNTTNDLLVTDELLWEIMQTGVYPNSTEYLTGRPLYFPANIYTSFDYAPLTDYETKLPIKEWLSLYGEEAAEFIEEYLMTLFNVDYRTTPDGEWADYIMNNWSILHTSGYPDAEERYWNLMNEYLDFSFYNGGDYDEKGVICIDTSAIEEREYDIYTPLYDEKGSFKATSIPYKFSRKDASIFALQLLCYLSSREPDVLESPTTKSTYRKPTVIKNKFSEVQQWDVGIRFGRTIRTQMAEQVKRKTERDVEERERNVDIGEERTRKRPAPHYRCAHWQHYWVGKGRTTCEVRWIEPVFVGFAEEDKKEARDVVIHKVS